MKKAVLFVVVCLAPTLGQARTTTVDDDGPADFNNIQAAINDANDGDIIEVQPGTYRGSGNRDIDFLGKAITVRSIDPNDPNIVANTIIDCNGTEAEPHRGFYFHSGEPPNSVISGLAITNGYADFGGGIYCDGSSPTIQNNIIKRNQAGTGGGVKCLGGNVAILNCDISVRFSHLLCGEKPIGNRFN